MVTLLSEEQTTTLRHQILRDQWEAHKRRFCQRKGVGVSIFRWHIVSSRIEHVLTEFNSGRIDGDHCTGERGNCGCSHAEPKALVRMLRQENPYSYRYPVAYILSCNYSPCSACAHAIVAAEWVRLVVYLHKTEHDLRGLEILERHTITAMQLGAHDPD